MAQKSLTPEQMEARIARFNKLQTYQRQNFEAHNIPPGAVEKVTARRVYPVMAPADYQGRSAGAPVSFVGLVDAVTTTGGVKCWGNNNHGQVGDGTTTDRATPVDVAGLTSGVAALSMDSHTCALLTDHTVQCWGYNSSGQFAGNSTTSSSVPVQVAASWP